MLRKEEKKISIHPSSISRIKEKLVMNEIDRCMNECREMS